jgi:hypothetical protein
MRAAIVALVFVVVPINERILVNESFADVFVGARDAEIAVTPCAVGQNHGGKAPFVGEIVEMDVAAQFGAGNEIDAGFTEPCVDASVFLFALLHVPARQAVLNFAVRPRILFEHGNPNAMIRQDFGGYGAGNGPADHGHEMFPGNRHYSVS